MRLRSVMIALLLTLGCSTAFAHGTKVHIVGTVEKINGDSVVVKTQDGKAVEVKLVASTVYVVRSENQDKPAKLADLATGYLVVIHATSKDSGLEAEQVKFSVKSAPKPVTPPASKPKS